MSEIGHAGLPRLLAGLAETGGRRALTLQEHEQTHGPLPRVTTSQLIEGIELSGLRGRGGADFPTHRKLRAVAAGRRQPIVVVNGSETEPASGKDALLLARLPHLVLDGAVLAARAVGANEVIVKVSDWSSAVDALQHAIAERADDGVGVRLSAVGGRYVSGEESAVVNSLGGGPPLPLFVPPRPFERGLRGRPTLIQNPETLAQIALVARFGPRWYRQLGTEEDPGSALVTITGAVGSPGVYELAFGTPMHTLIDAAEGETEPLRALLVGGYFGTWLDAREAWTFRLARAELSSHGVSLGSGVLIALGESACGLHESARVLSYLAGESAGQCGPCLYGLAAVSEVFTALVEGRVAPRPGIHRLRQLFEQVRGRGACHHPNGAVRFAESALRIFGGEIEAHAHSGCSAVPAGLPLAKVTTPPARRRRAA